MSTYICKCGRRVKKSTNADNTGNRLEGYGPGHECYGCPYVLSWGNYEWKEDAQKITLNVKGYECRMSPMLSYNSEFIGSTKDKCTCSVVSLDFDFLEQISSWVKKTFTSGELTGYFSRGEIRATDYCHNGRYQYTLCCSQNKKGIAAKAALFEHFFNLDGSRKDMTPQQEMEKVLADIRKATQAKEKLECTTMDSAAPSENAGTSFTTGGAPLSNGTGSMTEPVHSAPQDKPLAFLPETTIPEFDYSGLPEQTVENLHFAEDEYHHGKQMAERGLVHMGNAIAAAHDALCGVVQQLDNSKHGNRGDDSFRAWCCSIGITKSTAYNLLQVSALMDGSSPRQRAILEALPPTLLYAVAKPSAPADLVEKVKNGEVSTNKEYQDLLAQIKAEKERADSVEAQLEAAQADVTGLTEQNAKLQQSYHDADESRIAANLQRQKAEAERDRAEARAKDAENQLAGSRQVAEAAKLRGDKLKAENDALKKQPITGVVDKDEVKRQADAMSRKAVQEAQADAAEAKAELAKFQQAAEGYLAPEQACAQQAKVIADAIRSMYLNWLGQASDTDTPLARMGSALYAVCGEIMSSLEDGTTIHPTAAGSEEDAEREALFE